MHLIMLLVAIVVAWGCRWVWSQPVGSWSDRWQRTLSAFLLPPLLLVTTAIALLCMGPRGQMVRWWEGWGSYGLAIAFLSVAGLLGGKLALEGWRSLQQVRQYPQIEIQGKPTHLIENPTPYVAQVGFWEPELVLSQGLLDTLDAEHLAAVLVHEQAHRDHRDTFWFFWLGWLRRLTIWLPKTEALWQELLVLREIRADQQASRQVDGLLLAEALLAVVSAPMIQPDNICAAFSAVSMRDRLTERIEALLSEPSPGKPFQVWMWSWLLIVGLPFLVIPFHT
jgi:Zn-dependent protease with chaperone function